MAQLKLATIHDCAVAYAEALVRRLELSDERIIELRPIIVMFLESMIEDSLLVCHEQLVRPSRN